MTDKIKNICVFASASNDIAEIYYKAAQELGALIAESGYGFVYGGSRLGLMYAAAGAAKAKGGKVYGVMPEKFAEADLANPEDCDEFYITSGIRERKAKLDKISDAVIAISGGFGTLEEVAEMIVQKQLGYTNKPIVILNTNGLYDNLVKFFDDIIAQNFAKKSLYKVYYVANSPKDAIEYIKNYKFEESYGYIKSNSLSEIEV